VTINGKLNPCFSRLRGIETVTRWASNVEGDPAYVFTGKIVLLVEQNDYETR